MLARRRQRWLLRWREPPCRARPRVCCPGRQLQGRCRARLTRAALALRWQEPPCGARRRVCCLGQRLQGRCCARSTQVALASKLARAILWRKAHVSGGGASHPLAPGTSSVLPRRWLQGRCHARLTRAALASTLALATLWRKAARVLPRAMALRSLPCSLGAGCAGLYAGASHPVAQGGACAA